MRKHGKMMLALMMALVLLFGAMIPAAAFAKKEENASVTVEGSHYVAKGKKITLTASEAVTWKSSNTKVATVSAKGVVKGIKAGTTNITATPKKGFTAKKTWKITVTPKAVSSVKLSGDTDKLDLKKQKTVMLKATISPSTAAKSLTWKSSDTKVAKVNSKGKVTAVGKGETTITATATDGSNKKGTFKIKVYKDLSALGTLTIWCADNDVAETLIEKFKKDNPEYSDYTFVVEHHNEADAYSEYITAKELPDLITFPQDQLAMLVNHGALNTVSTRDFADDCGKGAVSAVTLGSKAYAYPITADNGFFLYYNKDIISDPSSLEAILADCEAAGKFFNMEITSGWYNVAFFFGAGCTIEYKTDASGYFTGITCDVGSAKGVKALKAMGKVAASPAFYNSVDRDNLKNSAAVVSGTWDAAAISDAWGKGYAAAKLPTVDGFQMYSFAGFKLIGVTTANSANKAAATALAKYLSSTEAQVLRAEKKEWLPARKSAQKKVSLGVSSKAMLAQLRYSVAQKQIAGSYWDIASQVANTVIEKVTDGKAPTDKWYQQLAEEYQVLLEETVVQ